MSAPATSSNGAGPPPAGPLERLGLTLGDLEDLENVAPDLDVLGALEHADKRLPVRLLTGLVWVTMRRSDPLLTLEAVRRMDLADLDLEAITAGLPKANRAARRNSASRSPAPGGSPPPTSAPRRSRK